MNMGVELEEGDVLEWDIGAGVLQQVTFKRIIKKPKVKVERYTIWIKEGGNMSLIWREGYGMYDLTITDGIPSIKVAK